MTRATACREVGVSGWAECPSGSTVMPPAASRLSEVGPRMVQSTDEAIVYRSAWALASA
ncbi:MAG: hypothetical protein L0K25_09195 [Acidipropionibacterium jensenii]|nr:hypothetical protein [Acidipropionibacterium jensenii]MDN6427350.1 hypothetical protein [Acidipropionibacterium jensenii]